MLSHPPRLSKRTLGEGYIVGTGVVLSGILLGQLVSVGAEQWLLTLICTIPALVLAASAYWVQRLGLTSEQVWTVANYSAFGLGAGTTVVLGLALVEQAAVRSTVDSVLLGATLTTIAVAGALGGLAHSLHASRRESEMRNAVLRRVMRHNLRNDLTVVLCLLDTLERQADEEGTEQVAKARTKLESLVDLTDKVRRATAGHESAGGARPKTDVAAVVKDRIEALETRHEDLHISAVLPERALAYADESVAVVFDNLVESAVSRTETETALDVHVVADRNTVSLKFEDPSQAIPEADLSAVASGAETDLEHGGGVELWLVHWLVEANGGTVTFESDSECTRIDVVFDRAGNGWLSR
jgi:K+-sensing histidine kinase KdpD